jgi:hypothetical protein
MIKHMTAPTAMTKMPVRSFAASYSFVIEHSSAAYM